MVVGGPAPVVAFAFGAYGDGRVGEGQCVDRAYGESRVVRDAPHRQSLRSDLQHQTDLAVVLRLCHQATQPRQVPFLPHRTTSLDDSIQAGKRGQDEIPVI